TWAEGNATPIGEDDILISTRLDALTADEVTMTTSFEPPADACFTLATPMMMARAVPSTPNNWQLVQRDDKGGTTLIWGVERFEITAVVRRSDGALLRATMQNPLTLKLAHSCDAAMEHCAAELPYWIKRTLK